MILCHQGILAFFPLRMQLDALDRANHLALRLVVVANAFSAFVGIDDIKLLSHRYRIVGTLWFANITVDALVSDAKCHVLKLTQLGECACSEHTGIQPLAFVLL